MSNKKSKLVLKRKTIAHLSNVEMGHFYGGDGDEEGNGTPTRKLCDEDEMAKSIKRAIVESNKVFLSKMLIIC